MTAPQSPLAHFRADCFHAFGLRRDGLQDLLDAVLTSDRVSSLVRLSLVPAFRRRWPSIFDALTDGTIDQDTLRQLWVSHLPPPPGARMLWAIDGSTWPRPEAKTSPERTCCRFVTSGIPENEIMPGWEYQWLVALPDSEGSWVLPLDLRRRSLAAGSPTSLAIAQLSAILAAAPSTLPRPMVVLDSHYDVPELVTSVPEVDVLARLASNRRFYRAPGPSTGPGRPRKHGPIFQCANPATHHTPQVVQSYPDPDYGQVTITAWEHLHTQPAPTVTSTVVQVAVAHLPRRDTPPKPLWLVWHGLTLPDDLRDLWHAYQRRFAVEHAFRLLKQDLGWTTPRLRARCRPVELAPGMRIVATVAGSDAGGRCPIALGACARAQPVAQSRPGPAGDVGPFSQAGVPSASPSTSRKRARPAGRDLSWPGHALSHPAAEPAKGHLSPPPDVRSCQTSPAPIRGDNPRLSKLK